MAPEMFGVIAVIGFGLAAVLVIVAAAYGVAHHVRSVHDELTGRAAQRAIDAMREGRSSVPALGGSTREPGGRAERQPKAARSEFPRP